MKRNAKPILVIGGGIAGMTASLEAAEVGYSVILVEKEAYLGGRVIRTHRYFPKMCPPTCGYEINIRRLRKNPRVTVHTLAEVKEVSGDVGEFQARIVIKPRYVTGRVAIDSSVLEKLSTNRTDDFNFGMSKTKAVYLPHDRAYPPHYVLDRSAISDADAKTLQDSFPRGAIDLEMKEKEICVDVGAIIVATGWRPYDANKLNVLGFGRYKDVVTNVMMERLAAKNGPTDGVILKPSDSKFPDSVAFVQCAGSRDDHHLPYCSAVCCTAALKQARYLIEQNEKTKISIFYIDIRTIGRLEKFYYDLLEEKNISFIKGKVAKVTSASDTSGLLLTVEDTLSGHILSQVFDMVVLSTGVVPNTADKKLPLKVPYDNYGFIDSATKDGGVFVTGCAKHPCDVSRTTKDATAAALKAIQCLERGK